MLKQFINDLGGSEAIAEQVSKMAPQPLSKRAVYQWPYDGTIPHKWRFYLAKLAKKKRLSKGSVPEEVREFFA